MIKRISYIIIANILLLVQIGCSSYFIDKYEGDTFIAVISDVHISDDESKEERLSRLIERINEGANPKIERLIITGDCVSSVYKDSSKGEAEGNNRLRKFIEFFKAISVPINPVMGNHDFKIDKSRDSDAPFDKSEIQQMEHLWTKITGFQSFYSADQNGWKLLFLNSMRGKYLNKSFDDEQLDWMASELQKGEPTLLFFHHPVETDNFRIWCKAKDLISIEPEPGLFNILSKYKSQIKGIFVGHGHMWVSDTLFDEIQVYETDSFGDNEEVTFAIIGLDNSKKNISVVKCVGIK
ncbi:metallophosphoesterase family protein [Bacteroidota bacterium]